ncbi:MAG: glycosyltransferase family 2 protein [Selenomonadaceae bacterium]
MFKLTVPVAVFIFNRPEVTRKVFAQIRLAKPNKLFVIADGPRQGNASDLVNCEQCRNIISEVDWDCEIITDYSPVNLGCGKRPKTGYDFVFNHVEEAIFLEDDCLPDISFFRFCQEMLEKYRYDQRIMMISGNNFLPGSYRSNDSYYFSKIMQSWGWATWRRAWNQYDFDIKLWPLLKKEKCLDNILGRKKDVFYWSERFQEVYDKRVTSAWDYQFLFAMWINNGLAIIPNVNLVSHIGFDGTHAQKEKSYEEDKNSSSGRPVTAMAFPLKHPKAIISNKASDQYMLDRHLMMPFRAKVKFKIELIKNRYNRE